METGTTPARPLRRDAERNRGLILGAAKVVFAQRGLEVSLDEVAKQAGVGVGTLYRRFPNRDALIEALFDDMVDATRAIAEHAAEHSRAWDGLVYFMTAVLETQGHDKGLRDVMLACEQDLVKYGHDKGQAVRDLVQPLFNGIVSRAQQEGDMRPDVVPTDIVVLLVAALGMVEFTAPAAPEMWRRQVSVILDGLRARPDDAAAPLPGPPLDDEQVDECMVGWKYGTRHRQARRRPSQPS